MYEDMLLFLGIVLGIGAALSGIAWMLTLKGIQDDKKFQNRVKKMYINLNEEEKQKYKDDKRKTLFSAIIVSMVIAIILTIVMWIQNPTQFDRPENYMILLLSEIGMFAFFLILSYMAINEHKQKKCLEIHSSNI